MSFRRGLEAEHLADGELRFGHLRERIAGAAIAGLGARITTAPCGRPIPRSSPTTRRGAAVPPVPARLRSMPPAGAELDGALEPPPATNTAERPPVANPGSEEVLPADVIHERASRATRFRREPARVSSRLPAVSRGAGPGAATECVA